MVETKKEYVNIFADLPEHGAVVATLTEHELEIVTELADTLASFRFAPQSEEWMEKYQEEAKKYRETWNAICRRYSIPTAWTITVDDGTGQIYVNKDK